MLYKIERQPNCQSSIIDDRHFLSSDWLKILWQPIGDSFEIDDTYQPTSSITTTFIMYAKFRLTQLYSTCRTEHRVNHLSTSTVSQFTLNSLESIAPQTPGLWKYHIALSTVGWWWKVVLPKWFSSWEIGALCGL